MDKKKNKGSGSIVIIIIAVVIIAFALYKLVPALIDYRTAEKTYEELGEQFVDAPDTAKEESEWWYTDVSIDLKSLKEINPEVVGWIRFDDLDALPIDYPILHNEDDQYYLHRDINGQKSGSGCIFLEAENQGDFSDIYNLIYGHNMKNLSMFGSLKKYRTEEGFYEDNQFFTVYSENMAYRYQIFAYRVAQDGSEIYTVGYQPDEVYQEFLDSMQTNNLCESDIRPTKDDYVMTLSTCTSRNEMERFVVHAVLVASHEYQ